MTSSSLGNNILWYFALHDLIFDAFVSKIILSLPFVLIVAMLFNEGGVSEPFDRVRGLQVLLVQIGCHIRFCCVPILYT